MWTADRLRTCLPGQGQQQCRRYAPEGASMDSHGAQEALMANKDKGGGHNKKAAAQNLKQKRQAKKAKKATKA
jgi:hypothetical protein